MQQEVRKTGVDIIGNVPWGTHFCQFYQTKEDLLSILVPYFKTGLEENEFAMWVTAEPLTVADAKKAMIKAMPNFGNYLTKGQIEIIPYTEWYLKDGYFDLNRVLDGWVDKLKQAISRGYAGIRVTGNTAWLERKDWNTFTDYEAAINSVIGKYRMLALCTYSLEKCNAGDVMDVIRNHEFALVRREGKWEVVENAVYKQAKQSLAESEKKYRQLMENLQEGVWVIDKDGRTTFINPHMAAMLGYTEDEMREKQLSELMDERSMEIARQRFEQRQRGMAKSVEFTFRRRDGSPLYTMVSATPLRDDAGNFSGIIAGIIDITERKRMEDEIREQLYILNLAHILICNINDEIIFWNHGVEKMYGFSKDEAVGKKPHQLLKTVFPKPLDEIKEELDRNGSWEGELIHKKQDGTQIVVASHWVLHRDKNNKPVAVIEVNNDITELKRAEEKLKETRDYLNNLLDYANAPIIVWDPQFLITGFNHAFERLTGLSTSEVLGKRLDILFPEDSKNESLDHIRKAVAGERWEIVEIPILHKDGSVRIVLWNSATLYAPDGKTAVATIAQGQDITERKQAEEALRETRDYLENLFNYANAPIIVWDPQFSITRFNHAFERLTGLSAGKVLGKQLDILFPEDSKNESLDHIRKAVAGERWEVVEIPILCTDGTVRTVLWNSATLYDTDGKTVIATIAQGQDITERKQAEEEIRKLNESLRQRAAELEAANKELEAFAYSVSHDLRAPLRSIEGFSQAVIEDFSDRLDEHGKDFLQRIQQSTELMGELIDGMLTLSQITRSEMQLGMVDLSELAQEIATELKQAEPKRTVQFIIMPGLKANGDKRLIRVVLENLLDNAWKFTGKVPQAKIEFGATERNGKLTYFVRDNGAGFDMAYASKIFMPFQRLHSLSDFPGIGIGLATVHRIIQRHSGQIWAEGEVGKGAIFYFTLG